MTALCGGGTSGANPTAAAVVSVTLDFLSIATDTYEIEWLAQALGAVGPFTPYVLATFCATDPPAMPSWTLAESTALQSLDLLSPDFATGAAKIPDWVANVVWNAYCQCTSGTYTPAANPATPVGTPIPTGALGLQTTAPCLRGLFNPAASFTGSQAATESGSTFTGLLSLPAGATSIQWIALMDQFSGTTNGTYRSQLSFYGADHTTVIGQSLTQDILVNTSFVSGFQRLWSPSSTTGQPVPTGATNNNAFDDAVTPLGQSVILPQGTQFVGCTYTRFGPSSADTIEVYFEVYCGGASPGGEASNGCCPIDPAVLSLLNATLKAVTLMQRQLAPFAYVLGTSHTVSGTGTIAVQGLLGAQVALTSVGNEVGEQFGTPVSLFGAGWINWGTADGYTAREYVDNTPFLSMPAEAGQYTLIGYSFPGASAATITEITREP